METVSLGAAVIALVSAAKTLDKRVQGIVTIGLAVVLGVVAGLAHFQGLDLVSGVVTALAAVGTMTVASQLGNK